MVLQWFPACFCTFPPVSILFPKHFQPRVHFQPLRASKSTFQHCCTFVALLLHFCKNRIFNPESIFNHYGTLNWPFNTVALLLHFCKNHVDERRLACNAWTSGRTLNRGVNKTRGVWGSPPALGLVAERTALTCRRDAGASLKKLCPNNSLTHPVPPPKHPKHPRTEVNSVLQSALFGAPISHISEVKVVTRFP